VPVADDGDSSAEAPAMLAVLAEMSELATFTGYLKACGLDSLLAQAGPFTLLAPDNSAFEVSGGDKLKTILGDADQARRFWSRYIIPGRVITFEQSGRIQVSALDGSVLEVVVDDVEVKVADAVVAEEAIWCANGVIHVIENVLGPGVGSYKDSNR
jgi:uncharacterized surface protein with fasciclin (FAS1) repeats